MRKSLSLVIVEEPDGGVAIQLFKEWDVGSELFGSLAGKPGDEPSRATMLEIDWEGGAIVKFQVKELPVKVDREKEPYGHRLGVGPIAEPGESDGETGN